MRLLRLLYPRYAHAAVTLIGALLGVSAAAHGDPRQGYVISIENDFFGAGSNNTDRWYTNGFQFAQSFRRDRLPEILKPARDFGSAILGRGDLDAGPTVAVSFGQNMYTPQNITLSEQQLNDRPWAGFLYLGAGVFDYFGAAHRAAELKVGVIGPASLAKQVQRGWHELIGADEPRGWDNQLRPSLGLQASYMHTHRFTRYAPRLWPGVHGFVRATAGRPKTLAAFGATLIVGERDRVVGAPDEGDFLAVDFNERQNQFSGLLQNLTFYVQGQLAAVAHNYFITGTTFREQPQVELKRSVWMATFGASWAVTKGSRLEYRLKRRSPDFTTDGMVADNRYQRYGELRFVADLDH